MCGESLALSPCSGECGTEAKDHGNVRLTWKQNEPSCRRSRRRMHAQVKRDVLLIEQGHTGESELYMIHLSTTAEHEHVPAVTRMNHLSRGDSVEQITYKGIRLWSVASLIPPCSLVLNLWLPLFSSLFSPGSSETPCLLFLRSLRLFSVSIPSLSAWGWSFEEMKRELEQNDSHLPALCPHMLRSDLTCNTINTAHRMQRYAHTQIQDCVWRADSNIVSIWTTH